MYVMKIRKSNRLVLSICAMGLAGSALAADPEATLRYLDEDGASGFNAAIAIPATEHLSIEAMFGQMKADDSLVASGIDLGGLTVKHKGFAVKYRNDFREDLFVTSEIGYLDQSTTANGVVESVGYVRGLIGVGSKIGDRFEYEFGVEHLKSREDMIKSETDAYYRVGLNFTSDFRVDFFHRAISSQTGVGFVYNW